MGDDRPGRRPHRRGPARRLTRRPRGRTYSRFVLTVIPFRAEGKSRLPEDLRREVALAMLGDVVEVALAVGEVRVVTDDPAGRLVAGDLGARLVDDPGSAARFRDHAAALGIDVEALVLGNLVDDVDTLSDLVRFGTRAGARTAELVDAIAL